ncbi:unnamed protein product [Caenorhabditis angaria]|uniref:Uncharacterized protein n=1 Tax=Caenorhabditis angaria TaxID=860376 RepID=A0A9P1INM3_9PELO|nr:unnamed protein product [Caenorhabditis angaria]
MGSGVSSTSSTSFISSSSNQPIYLTRSTMLITHTPIPPTQPTCHIRRHSSAINNHGTGTGISSQLTMPLQFYPNNVYHTNLSNSGSGVAPIQPQQQQLQRVPSAPPMQQETPPSYSSIYPNLS